MKLEIIVAAMTLAGVLSISGCSSASGSEASIQGTWACSGSTTTYDGHDFKETIGDNSLSGTFTIKGDKMSKTYKVIYMDGVGTTVDRTTVFTVNEISSTKLDIFSIDRFENGVELPNAPAVGHRYQCER